MMRSQIQIISLVACVMLAAAGIAQTPASAPAGSTGLCRDGTYWTGATKKGACHGHKGVQDWYGSVSPTSDSAAAPTAVTPAATPTAPAATPPPAAPKAAPAPAGAQAPGGGAGQVWVNSSSKVYHCPADRWYGKTKSGVYMSEADAIAQGNRADHGKACNK
jgi:hypothetical protein